MSDIYVLLVNLDPEIPGYELVGPFASIKAACHFRGDTYPNGVWILDIEADAVTPDEYMAKLELWP